MICASAIIADSVRHERDRLDLGVLAASANSNSSTRVAWRLNTQKFTPSAAAVAPAESVSRAASHKAGP